MKKSIGWERLRLGLFEEFYLFVPMSRFLWDQKICEDRFTGFQQMN